MRKDYLGVSMIEVLIAMGMISLVLLSLLSYQISAIKNLNQTRYQTIADIQLLNFSEMLRANKSDSARDSALRAWNTDNKHLLPQGIGVLNQQDDHQCEIKINWIFRKQKTESMMVFC